MKSFIDAILNDQMAYLEKWDHTTGTCSNVRSGLKSELVKHLLAREFVAGLAACLEPYEFQLVLERNEADINDRQICHSHDFCDANVVMAYAFKQVLGREPAMDGTAQQDADLETTNEAWNYAREHLLRKQP